MRNLRSPRETADRRVDDQALRASEERLALALAASRMGVWEWSVEQTHAHFSSEVYEMLDIDAPGPDGGTMSFVALADHLHAGDLAELTRALRNAVEAGVDFVVDVRCYDRHRALRWLEDRGRIVRDAQGRPQRMIGTIRDITEQREAQSLIAREAVRRREFIEQSRDGVLVLDPQGRVQEANPAMASMLGLAPDSLINVGVADLGITLPMAEGRTVLQSPAGTRLSLEARLTRSDGSTLELEISASAVAVDGQPLVFAVCRDVTQRKQAENALRDSERRLSLALAASGMAVWEWDLVAERMHLSPDGARQLGRDPSRDDDVEISTAELLQVVHRDDQGALMAARHAAVHAGKGFAGEFRVFGFDGRLRRLQERGQLERAADGTPLRLLGTQLDVTEQHRIQQRLRDDATRRRVMVEQSPDGVVVFRPDGSVEEVNAAFARLMGYRIDELLALHLWELDADLSREQALALFDYPQQGPVSFVSRARRKGGQLIMIEINASRVALDDRTVYFCVCRDVTQRQAVEAALRDSEARYRATFENSAVGIAENALDGRWLSVNPRLCEITGYPREALLALAPGQLDHPDDPHDDWDRLCRLLQGEQRSVRLEKRYLRSDGSTIWVARTSSLARDATGAPSHCVSVIEDITERKRIEGELAGHRQRLESQVARRTAELQAAMQAQQASEHFLRSIADNIPDMVGYWDARRVLRFANRPYAQWIAPGRQALGLPRSELIGPPEQDPGEAAFAAALRGEAQRFEHPLLGPAGELRHTWVHYIPDQQAGGVAGLFVLLSDISEVKQTELRLQILNDQLVAARDRAEAANRAKSAFLANISHEIRTPMNAIIGLTHLMRRDQGDDVTRERLGKVSEAAHHLLGVINDVLDLSKIESGKLRLDPTDFPVDAVLRRAVSLVAEQARSKGLLLQLHNDGVPPLLRGDPTRVSQALLNLMSNAVKFTDHGSIALCCSVQPGDAQAPPQSVLLRFEVRDTGVGVPPDKVGRLFNAFEQVDTSTTRRFGGTGLGLAITRRLAQMMGGEVGFEPQPGHGSCFWFSARFELALAPEPADRPRAGAEAERRDPQAKERALRDSHAGARVLLAEDNPINQEVARELLAAAGLVVDVVNDGQEAVQRASDTAYDLVLMDMQMPVLDGLAATRALRSMPHHARTPILAMTANAFGDDRQACLAAGMDDHLAKPVDPEMLYGMLGRWLPARLANAGITPAPGPALPLAVPVAPDFSGIAGLVMSRALLYLPGRDQVYARVLGQFAGSYREGLAGLDSAVAAGRWLLAGQLLHSLRGACGAVGAVALGHQGRSLEDDLAALQGRASDATDAALGDEPGNEPVDDADDRSAAAQADDDRSVDRVRADSAALQAALRTLVAAIDQRLQGAGDAAASAADGAPPADSLEPALDALAEMLRMADFQAGAKLREIEPLLRLAFGEPGARSVERPLREHDYDAALLALQGLRRHPAGA